MLGHVPSLFCKRVREVSPVRRTWNAEHLYLSHHLISSSSFSSSSSSDVPKTGTRLAGIICRVANIFAMNVSITTTGGNADWSFYFHTGLHKYVLRPMFHLLLWFSDSHKDGYEIFASWKRVWTSNGKSEPSLKAFMADQQLPYWVNKQLPRSRLGLGFLLRDWMWTLESANMLVCCFIFVF